MNPAVQTSEPNTHRNVSAEHCELTEADLLWVCELLALDNVARPTLSDMGHNFVSQLRSLAGCESDQQRQRLSQMIRSSDTFTVRTDLGFVMAKTYDTTRDPHLWHITAWGLMDGGAADTYIRPLIDLLCSRGDVEVPVPAGSNWQNQAVARPGAVVVSRLWGKSLPSTPNTASDNTSLAIFDNVDGITAQLHRIDEHSTGQQGTGQQDTGQISSAKNSAAPKSAVHKSAGPQDTHHNSAIAPDRQLSDYLRGVASQCSAEQVVVKAEEASSLCALEEASSLGTSHGASALYYQEKPQDDAVHGPDLTAGGYRLIHEVWQLPST